MATILQKFTFDGARGIPTSIDKATVRAFVKRQMSLTELGKRIAKGVAFDEKDDSVVLVNEKSFEIAH